MRDECLYFLFIAELVFIMYLIIIINRDVFLKTILTFVCQQSRQCCYSYTSSAPQRKNAVCANKKHTVILPLSVGFLFNPLPYVHSRYAIMEEHY